MKKSTENNSTENEVNEVETVATELEVYCIGAGDALSVNHGDSSFLIRRVDIVNGERLEMNILFDCGSTTYKNLLRRFGKINIDGVIITHNHADHSGSLEQLAFYQKLVHKNRIKVYVGSQDVADLLWTGTLSGGMSVFGKKEEYLDFKIGEASILFDSYNWIKNDHCGMSYPCYGFAFRVGEFSMWISGDTKFSKERFHLVHDVYIPTKLGMKPSVILHECAFYEMENPIHTLFKDFKTLPENLKNKTLLYHYSDSIDSFKSTIQEECFMGYVVDNNSTYLLHPFITHREDVYSIKTDIKHSHNV